MITKHKFNTPHAGNNHLKLTRMKKILRLFLVGSLLLVSCQDDEEMKYASVYFPLATWADGNGIFQTKFDFSRDTTYIVGAYCSGSIMPEHDIRTRWLPPSRLRQPSVPTICCPNRPTPWNLPASNAPSAGVPKEAICW